MSVSAALTICVIDDDEACRHSMRALLESYGLNVKDYGSARAFLTDERPEEGCCLLVDLHMPDMNGLELIENLQARNAAYPVIMMTGRGDDLLRRRAIEAGAAAFLDKPVDADHIWDAIAQVRRNAPQILCA